eukprot:29231-Eustigmatos_ZCMA.PRE.1
MMPYLLQPFSACWQVASPALKAPSVAASELNSRPRSQSFSYCASPSPSFTSSSCSSPSRSSSTQDDF